jgi:ubiquinone/menaquinone biosynthesis C-methylase UbiE
MKFFGVFKQLKDLNLSTEEMDLYEGFFAQFYDDLTSKITYDIKFYQEQARLAQGTILELACGSGRVALNLAQHGFKVEGIDKSPSMLNILEKKLEQYPELRDKVSYHLGDMLTFDLKKNFNLVILPATSICLIPDNEKVLWLFDNIYNHLNKGGKFIFDYTISNIKENKLLEELPIHVHTLENEEFKQFVLFGEQYDYRNMQIHVNFYGEIIKNNGQTLRKFGYTLKRLLTDKIISDLIRQTPFKLSHTHVIKDEYNHIRFIVLEK